MRNYELLEYIAKQVSNRYASPEQRVFRVLDAIKLHRPELLGELPTHESLMEEMRKYPHQDNHMD